MTAPIRPVVVSCGEPAGIGPEIATRAWAVLKDDITIAWMGDPRHLPQGTDFAVIESPDDAASVCAKALPVLAFPFAEPCMPGLANPANAQGVIDVIAACVDLVRSGSAAALCTAPIHKKALMDGADFA